MMATDPPPDLAEGMELESAHRKVSRARDLDLWDVTLSLNEVHAILHATRAPWCNEIRAHDSHYAILQGQKEWCWADG